MNMVVSHWSANVAVLAGCLVIAAVHLAGVRGMTADARPGGPAAPGGLGRALVREAIAFDAGLAVVLLALVSPVAYWARDFIWVRSLQDLLLAVVAPPLIVLGAPWLPLRRGLSPRRSGPVPASGAEALGSATTGPGAAGSGAAGSGAAGSGAAGSGAAGPGAAGPGAAGPGAAGAGAAGPGARPVAKRSAGGWLSWPVAVTAAFTVAWCGWHIPVLYDAALRYPVVWAAEVVSYLGVGVLFWLQLIGSRPLAPRFRPLQRVMLIAGTVVTSTILGMVLGFGANVLYPAYRGAGHHHLLTVVADQQLGGAILWVLVLPPYIIAGVALLLRWLNDEESEALALGFDRLLRPPRSAWPTRTGLR
ncbi:MAG TPA: cytochrome c oxidase assembly protein [Streptosporangiaceae bacterium]